MFFFTLILGIWILPKADSLECNECLPDIFGNCTEGTKVCPSADYQCAATRVTIYLGGFKLVDVPAKKCAMAQECLEGSINFGTAKIVTKSQCCNTKSCNANDVPASTSFVQNGRRCFSCEGTECGRTLNCDKNEDYCIKSTMKVDGQRLTMKGCASKLMCSDQVTANIKDVTGSEISCCQGDYCNSASSSSVGWPVLVVPLLSLLLLS